MAIKPIDQKDMIGKVISRDLIAKDDGFWSFVHQPDSTLKLSLGEHNKIGQYFLVSKDGTLLSGTAQELNNHLARCYLPQIKTTTSDTGSHFTNQEVFSKVDLVYFIQDLGFFTVDNLEDVEKLTQMHIEKIYSEGAGVEYDHKRGIVTTKKERDLNEALDLYDAYSDMARRALDSQLPSFESLDSKTQMFWVEMSKKFQLK